MTQFVDDKTRGKRCCKREKKTDKVVRGNFQTCVHRHLLALFTSALITLTEDVSNFF